MVYTPTLGRASYATVTTEAELRLALAAGTGYVEIPSGTTISSAFTTPIALPATLKRLRIAPDAFVQKTTTNSQQLFQMTEARTTELVIELYGTVQGAVTSTAAPNFALGTAFYIGDSSAAVLASGAGPAAGALGAVRIEGTGTIKNFGDHAITATFCEPVIEGITIRDNVCGMKLAQVRNAVVKDITIRDIIGREAAAQTQVAVLRIASVFDPTTNQQTRYVKLVGNKIFNCNSQAAVSIAEGQDIEIKHNTFQEALVGVSIAGVTAGSTALKIDNIDITNNRFTSMSGARSDPNCPYVLSGFLTVAGSNSSNKPTVYLANNVSRGTGNCTDAISKAELFLSGNQTLFLDGSNDFAPTASAFNMYVTGTGNALTAHGAVFKAGAYGIYVEAGAVLTGRALDLYGCGTLTNMWGAAGNGTGFVRKNTRYETGVGTGDNTSGAGAWSVHGASVTTHG